MNASLQIAPNLKSSGVHASWAWPLAHLFCGFYIFSFLVGCGGRRESVPGHGRVHTVEYQEQWITLVMQRGVRPYELVAIELFHGLKPKTTHAAVVDLLGEPSNVRRENHNTYYEYHFRDGRVEIGREESSSGADWSLSAYPANLSYRDVLSHDAIASFELRSPSKVIQILNESRELNFIIVISGTRVEKIGWLRR